MGDAVQSIKSAIIGELEAIGWSTSAGCRCVGYPRASFYRHHRAAAKQTRPPIPQSQRHQPAALTGEERARILQELSKDAYTNLSVGQVFYRVWDAGCYIASRSSWYRVAADHGMVGDRRGQAQSNPRKKPELVAHAPGKVWSWDITKLRTPVRGVFWHLYVIVDVYSRYVVAWELQPYEDATIAAAMIERATAQYGRPDYLHSDNGPAMVSKPVSRLSSLLGVELSFSRPRVSNDNPFSESLFKTCKYVLEFPGIFDHFNDAFTYCSWFFSSYNTEHRHSAIGYHTPENVHFQRSSGVTAKRRGLLDKSHRKNPVRYAQRPRPPRLPGRVHINQPMKKSTDLSQTS